MSERNDGDEIEGQQPADGGGPQAKGDAHLPVTESPPLSPAGDTAEPVSTTGSDLIPWTPPKMGPGATSETAPRFRLRPRHRRQALLAASIAFATLFGAAVGAWAVRGGSTGAGMSAAVHEENKAMAQSIAHLTKQVAALKTNLAAAKHAAHTEIAKIAARADRAPEVTGSIPHTVANPPAAVPLPRPAPRIAAVQSKPAVAAHWRVVGARNGYVFVTNGGDLFRVEPGAVLPGLGRVQSVERRDGRWLVMTPGTLIVSERMPDRFVERYSDRFPDGPRYYRDY